MDIATVPKFTVLIRKVEQISTNESAKLTELKSHLIIIAKNLGVRRVESDRYGH